MEYLQFVDLPFVVNLLILAGLVILSVFWLLLPVLLLSRLTKIHNTLLRIERSGKPGGGENPFEM